MNDIYIAIVLGVLGAALGSYAGALVWRLRAKQLVEDKATGEKVDTKELKRLKPLTRISLLKDRSIDLETGKQLKWYDLIPIISYISLRGKSRYSGKPIGRGELLIELGLAAFFVLSFVFWPYELVTVPAIIQFIVWLIAGVGLATLFSYDVRWFLLPDRVNFTVIGLGLVYATLSVVGAVDVAAQLTSILVGVFILSGIYLVLWLISKGRWIGFGDVKLGLGLALLLADWQLAFLALFAANLIGTLLVVPFMITGKLQRGAHVPFGPLLIAGAVLTQVFGVYIIDAYFSLFAL